MQHRLRWLVAGISALTLAACGDDGNKNDDPESDAGDTQDVTESDGTETDTTPDEDTAEDTIDPEPDTGNDVEGDAEVDAGEDADAGNPLPDGLFIEGLSAEVGVFIDEYGIPHFDCQTNNDCAAALGYFHARDRFAQMDLRRRLTSGRLSQLVGELGEELAVDNRLLYSTPAGSPSEQALYDAATPETIALLEAYSNGVNAFLYDYENGRNDADIADEYGFGLVNANDIPRWTPQDSFSTVLALIESLTNDSSRELALGEAYAAVEDPLLASDYYDPRPATTSVIMDEFGVTYTGPDEKSLDIRAHVDADMLRRASPALAEARERIERMRPPEDVLGRSTGSNNWVVGPDATAAGNALLSNDPHLGLSNPAIWYVAHMDAKTNGTGTYHAAGVTFAGLPWVILGQNEDIAWGATNTFFDFTDVYVETLSEDGSGVIFNDEVVPFTVVPFTPDLGNGESGETVDMLFVPHHGPVLSVDEEAGTAISLMWTGNRVSTDGNVLTELMAATNVEEARDAVRNTTTIGQNWVVIDTSGNIGWFPYNNVPLRPWATEQAPWLPLDGGGDYEWQGYFDLEDLPQGYNPPVPYIATANNDMTGALLDGDPTNDGWAPLQAYSASGFRHEQIIDLLEADNGSHTTDTMLAIVGDVYSLIGSYISPILLDGVTGETLTAEGQEIVSLISAWDYQCPTGLEGSDPEGAAVTDEAELASARGCAAFHAFYFALYNAIFDDDYVVNELVRYPSSYLVYILLTRPEDLNYGTDYFDDLTTEDVEEGLTEALVSAADAAGAQLTELIGADSDTWLWGRIHTVTLRADLFSSLGVDAYDNGPYANDGGLYTVDVANPSNGFDGNYSHGSGPSMRFVCEGFEAGVECTIQIPGGQRHYRDSDNYDDLLARWLENEEIEISMDVGEVSTNPASEWTAQPLSAASDE